ncbi:MAG: adenine deaminase [Bacteroidetes bacterium]|nr:adenine deaminase [Bacteroidota bacterium]PTM15738.1 MAG: adenine deaminase [Bacteroidota bacterium]
MTVIEGNLVDPVKREIYPALLEIEDGIISHIKPAEKVTAGRYIIPGFVDAHIHIESSMVVPAEFARLAVQHGTIATVSDPHEIANVCGIEGVEYMIENSRLVPMKFHFGAPSCVPATDFETSGARLDFEEVEQLLDREDILYLSEMMNWPAVLNDDPAVYAKLNAAKKRGKPIDGHAPGLMGERAKKYASAGITTDHECFTYEEGLDKIRCGMMIAIREGSAAKNFQSLIPLLGEFPDRIMFCSDDKHPDDLLEGHINQLAARAVAQGFDLFDVLSACSVNTIRHYNLPVGMLQKGDRADFAIVSDLEQFHVSETWIDGECVYNGSVQFSNPEAAPINHFTKSEVKNQDFEIRTDHDGLLEVPVIVALDGELITEKHVETLQADQGLILPDPDRDILKIALINRYKKSPVSVGFIKNFGLTAGAIASSVAHDSHNIIAVGTDDESLRRVVQLIMDHEGGIAVASPDGDEILPLPVGGIMSSEPAEQVAEKYKHLTERAKTMGSKLQAPFMTISFMGLLVIPSLKMSDLGLFDGETFQFVYRTGDRL